MLGKEKSKERGPSSLGPRHFTEGHHQVLQVKSEKEKLFLSRTKKAVRSLERSHHDRDYKVPFVQLLQSPQREEQSVRPSLNQDVQTTLSAHGEQCQNCSFQLKQIWVKTPSDTLLQQHEKVMEQIAAKQSLNCNYKCEEEKGDSRATTLEGELLCLQKMIKHQQEMFTTMEKMLSSLAEQQRLLTKEEETQHSEQQQTITKLKVQVKDLEEKNEALLREKHQLIEEQAKLKQQIEVLNAKAEVYREDFETERRDREKAVAQKEQYRSELLSLQKQLQQAKDILE